MKQTLHLLLIFLGGQLFAQAPLTPFRNEPVDSSTFIQYTPGRPDFVFAYSAESYWWSNTENFKMLTRKGTQWSVWTYKRKWKSSTEVQENNGKKRKRNFTMIAKVDSQAVNQLLDSLELIKFWALNSDSLNADRGISISDEINYKFKIESTNESKLVESYAPDFYIQKFSDMNDRAIFIKGRDIFARWWKKYSR